MTNSKCPHKTEIESLLFQQRPVQRTFLNWRQGCPPLHGSNAIHRRPLQTLQRQHPDTVTGTKMGNWGPEREMNCYSLVMKKSGLTPSAHCLHHQCRTPKARAGAQPKQLSTLCSVPAHVSLSPQGSVLLCHGCSPSSTAGRALPRTALGSGEKSQTAVHVQKANPSGKINLAQSWINSMRSS